MSARALRIGLVGAGLIGRKHARYLKQSPDCTLAAIADPMPEADTVAAEHGAVLYGDVETMLASHDLDGVIIAAPNDLHAAFGIAAARRGLPMIVEKPIAADLDGAARLTEAAKAADVPVLVGHHRRYDPRARHARALVAEGSLGRLVGVNLVWCVRKPAPYFDAEWRRLPGGGPILINLIHEIDLLRFICGEIAEVMAFASSAIRGFAVEDSAGVALRFENGALGTILLSDAAPSPWSWEQATGENHPTFPANEENPSRLFFTEAALEFPRPRIWHHDGEASWQNTLTSEPFPLPEVDVFAEQIAHFAGVIRGEEEPIITAEDASRSLAATLAVIEAAESGKAVRL
ncbi:MAG: Gfo/Idh/MocA family oxidoreductase [Alphaproteobacteria bacterium]